MYDDENAPAEFDTDSWAGACIDVESAANC